MKTNQENPWRYERKYLIPPSISNDIEYLIFTCKCNFKETYHERLINSIYLDDDNFDFYRSSIEGSHIRNKVRLRWYGKSSYSNINLEVKSKHGVVGKKYIHKLPKVDTKLLTNLNYKKILNITNELEHDSSICFANLDMKLYVSYVRKYFLSFDEKYRITIDRNLKYSRLDYLQNMRNLSLTDDNSVILEIKYKVQDDELAYQLQDTLPIRLDKFSKYTRGIDMLYSV